MIYRNTSNFKSKKRIVVIINCVSDYYADGKDQYRNSSINKISKLKNKLLTKQQKLIN